MAKIQIFLNVYDLIPQNEFLFSLGAGAYHSGVEIQGVEYSFGRHDMDGVSGVFETTPKTVLPLREAILMGEVDLSSHQIQDVIYELKPLFLGTSYHILKRNCNSFSAELCQRLLHCSIPPYVNRIAWMGSFVQCILPQDFQDVIPDTPNSSTTSRFPGEAAALSSSSISVPLAAKTNEPEDAAVRRERHARAAALRNQQQLD